MKKIKNSLFVLFLFIGYCVCTKHNGDVKRGARRRHDNEGTITGDLIEYPCLVSDLKCIRKFFSTHGRCRPAHDPVPNTVIVDHLSFRMATSNLSAAVVNAEITGLNGNITSFYINKKTDNLVIAFDSKSLTLASSHITFIFYPVGKEPIKITDYYSITLKSVTFTGVIPKIKDLQLAQADAYVYLNDRNPKYKVGPSLRNSKDPLVVKALCDLKSNIAANAKESLVIQAPTFMKLFIESKICKFGVPIRN